MKKKSVTVPTPMEERGRLKCDAAAFYALRQREAAHGYRHYAICAYDRRRDVVYLRYSPVVVNAEEATLPNHNPIYRVNLTTNVCDCPDARAGVAFFNRCLIARGLPPTLTCKHPLIVAWKQVEDSALLYRAPCLTERDKAVGISLRRVWEIGRTELTRYRARGIRFAGGETQ